MDNKIYYNPNDLKGVATAVAEAAKGAKRYGQCTKVEVNRVKGDYFLSCSKAFVYNGPHQKMVVEAIYDAFVRIQPEPFDTFKVVFVAGNTIIKTVTVYKNGK